MAAIESTQAKVAKRILAVATARPELTIVEAAGVAAWASIQEVQKLRWTRREQIGMAHAFADVAARMHTEVTGQTLTADQIIASMTTSK